MSNRVKKRIDVPKVKTTLSLSVETYRRLSVHAAMSSVDRSVLVEQLIQTHLRRYVVSDRSRVGDTVESSQVEVTAMHPVPIDGA